MRIQTGLVYAVGLASTLIFVLYLGFMTDYFVLFYDGTDEMYEFYKQLQIFNKDAFIIALRIMVLTVILMTFELQKYRPGLFGLVYLLGMTTYITLNSFPLLDDLPKYKSDYLAFDFTVLRDYSPSTFAFDIGIIFHYVHIVLLIALCIVAVATFVQRLREGHSIIRNIL